MWAALELGRRVCNEDLSRWLKVVELWAALGLSRRARDKDLLGEVGEDEDRRMVKIK